MPERDETMPNGAWAFDSEVTAVFGDMLARSICGYEQMRELVTRVGMGFAAPSPMLDLGSSRGDTIAPFVVSHTFSSFIGIDSSEPMCEFASLRFAHHSNVQILCADIMEAGLPEVEFGLITAVLTLQFLHHRDRLNLMRVVRNRIAEDGAFILVEKVIASDGPSSRVLEPLYDDHKRRHGYSDESIIRKKAALAGVMEPNTAHVNELLLYEAGFDSVECFWRHLNFAAWVAQP